MTPSGFSDVGHTHVFQPTSPVKAGFDIIQDHLNAQLSSADSEPAPKFDIKPTNLARPILFRSQTRKSSEPDSGHGSEIEENNRISPNQSILKRASPKYVKASPEIISASKKKAILTSKVQQPVLEPLVQLVAVPRATEKKREEEISTETMIETCQQIEAQAPKIENELVEESFNSEESSSIHPNTSDYIEEAKKICAGVFSNITERFSREKTSNEESGNEETRDRARSYAIVDDRDIMASEREAAPIRKSRSMTDLLFSSNGVLIIGILGALVSAGYMFFRHQYS